LDSEILGIAVSKYFFGIKVHLTPNTQYGDLSKQFDTNLYSFVAKLILVFSYIIGKFNDSQSEITEMPYLVHA